MRVVSSFYINPLELTTIKWIKTLKLLLLIVFIVLFWYNNFIMADLDRAKEYIGALKVYLALITALMIADIGGTVRLYQNHTVDFTFWMGIFTIIILSIIFALLARHMHKKIDQLKDL